MGSYLFTFDSDMHRLFVTVQPVAGHARILRGVVHRAARDDERVVLVVLGDARLVLVVDLLAVLQPGDCQEGVL